MQSAIVILVLLARFINNGNCNQGHHEGPGDQHHHNDSHTKPTGMSASRSQFHDEDGGKFHPHVGRAIQQASSQRPKPRPPSTAKKSPANRSRGRQPTQGRQTPKPRVPTARTASTPIRKKCIIVRRPGSARPQCGLFGLGCCRVEGGGGCCIAASLVCNSARRCVKSPPAPSTRPQLGRVPSPIPSPAAYPGPLSPPSQSPVLYGSPIPVPPIVSPPAATTPPSTIPVPPIVSPPAATTPPSTIPVPPVVSPPAATTPPSPKRSPPPSTSPQQVDQSSFSHIPSKSVVQLPSGAIIRFPTTSTHRILITEITGTNRAARRATTPNLYGSPSCGLMAQPCCDWHTCYLGSQCNTSTMLCGPSHGNSRVHKRMEPRRSPIASPPQSPPAQRCGREGQRCCRSRMNPRLPGSCLMQHLKCRMVPGSSAMSCQPHQPQRLTLLFTAANNQSTPSAAVTPCGNWMQPCCKKEINKKFCNNGYVCKDTGLLDERNGTKLSVCQDASNAPTCQGPVDSRGAQCGKLGQTCCWSSDKKSRCCGKANIDDDGYQVASLKCDTKSNTCRWNKVCTPYWQKWDRNHAVNITFTTTDPTYFTRPLIKKKLERHTSWFVPNTWAKNNSVANKSALVASTGTACGSAGQPCCGKWDMCFGPDLQCHAVSARKGSRAKLCKPICGHLGLPCCADKEQGHFCSYLNLACTPAAAGKLGGKTSRTCVLRSSGADGPSNAAATAATYPAPASSCGGMMQSCCSKGRTCSEGLACKKCQSGNRRCEPTKPNPAQPAKTQHHKP